MLLARNCGNHPNPTVVDNEIGPLVDELQFLIGVIQKRLTSFTYPFPHARGPLTVADYARSEKASDSKWERAYLERNAATVRWFNVSDSVTHAAHSFRAYGLTNGTASVLRC